MEGNGPSVVFILPADLLCSCNPTVSYKENFFLFAIALPRFFNLQYISGGLGGNGILYFIYLVCADDFSWLIFSRGHRYIASHCLLVVLWDIFSEWVAYK
jgi:hypothetical protein